MVKNCDLGLENAALGLRPRAVFSRPRSQFFTIRTSQPANNIYVLYTLFNSRAKGIEPYKYSSICQCPGLISSPILLGYLMVKIRNVS